MGPFWFSMEPIKHTQEALYPVLGVFLPATPTVTVIGDVSFEKQLHTIG